MNSYQKWNDEQCAKHCHMPRSASCYPCMHHGTGEDVWRAAYESILKEIDSRVSPNISEIARIIKKELENHNEKL